MKSKQGFTLIELLVVIAIIGILAGLVIISMSGSQNAAKNARIQSDLDQLRTTAEIFKLTNGNGSYCSGTGCTVAITATTSVANTAHFLDATFGDGQRLFADISGQGGAPVMYVTATAYCVQASLNGTTSKWCIDSLGNNGSASTSCTVSHGTCN
ncbi:MAG TPA: prepilin-type N-terminal cleavage/methylation domain-containing protein [Candidatus Paceibacterota bacterium]|nr:prepilin-type N-terminal cleavage/methylation domain-containing protein [Candidatus Paceibacterota bacterium]